jgi:hypothetical protein
MIVEDVKIYSLTSQNCSILPNLTQQQNSIVLPFCGMSYTGGTPDEHNDTDGSSTEDVHAVWFIIRETSRFRAPQADIRCRAAPE